MYIHSNPTYLVAFTLKDREKIIEAVDEVFKVLCSSEKIKILLQLADILDPPKLGDTKWKA